MTYRLITTTMSGPQDNLRFIKEYSASQITIDVLMIDDTGAVNPGNDRDQIWGIAWDLALENNRIAQNHVFCVNPGSEVLFNN